jgi:hypothetical protein
MLVLYGGRIKRLLLRKMIFPKVLVHLVLQYRWESLVTFEVLGDHNYISSIIFASLVGTNLQLVDYGGSKCTVTIL